MCSLFVCARINAAHQLQSLAPAGEPAADNEFDRIAASAEVRLAEITAELGDTYFAWHGNADGSRRIYYPIQGPTLIIEFSTQGNLGGDAGHYLSIYRNPANEYGKPPTRMPLSSRRPVLGGVQQAVTWPGAPRRT